MDNQKESTKKQAAEIIMGIHDVLSRQVTMNIIMFGVQ